MPPLTRHPPPSCHSESAAAESQAAAADATTNAESTNIESDAAKSHAKTTDAAATTQSVVEHLNLARIENKNKPTTSLMPTLPVSPN